MAADTSKAYVSPSHCRPPLTTTTLTHSPSPPPAASPLPASANTTPTSLQPNPRGIPPFPFMTSISDYCKTLADVSPTLNRFQEMINKYQFMESNVQQRAASLRDKLPEMRSTLSTVKFLRRQREKTTSKTDDGESEVDLDAEKPGALEATFPLSDTLYARAHIHPTTTSDVYLWLGANVMVAYPLAEAEELLADKERKARQSLGECEEDLEFLRVQITTLEVATARVYNWDVGEKRRLRARGEEVPGEEQGGGEGKT